MELQGLKARLKEGGFNDIIRNPNFQKGIGSDLSAKEFYEKRSCKHLYSYMIFDWQLN